MAGATYARESRGETMKQPAKVQNCRTHHYACDCREWHYQQCIKALKIINEWADMVEKRAKKGDYAAIIFPIAGIGNKCRDTLAALKDTKESP
jgi:hypothetical protein